MKDILTSILRTVVPIIVGLILAGFAKAGLNIEPGAVEHIVEVTVTGAYYGVVRWLETVGSPLWGWLIGFAKRPVYTD